MRAKKSLKASLTGWSLAGLLLIGGTNLSGGTNITHPLKQLDDCLMAEEYTAFSSPEPVSIRGYTDDAMEPFLSADGQILFFNNRNDPDVDTNLHAAYRIDDTTFAYVGTLEGANSPALDGVPTVDKHGVFYFVSTRSYSRTLSTIYRGRFADNQVSDVQLVDGISRNQAGIINFDVEISADGQTLYFVDGRFGQGPMPEAADLVIAVRHDEGFERLENSAELLRNVNTEQLEYAAALSADERELFFTRVDQNQTPVPLPRIYRTIRDQQDAPFQCPQHVIGITGFVEAPTLSPDGLSLYYHRLAGDAFRLYRVTRSAVEQSQ